MVAPVTSGELRHGEDWDYFAGDLNAFNQPMQLLGLEIDKQTQAMLSPPTSWEDAARD